jgi:transposase
MTHLSGDDRSQILLLPEVVDDYVGADNPVRFIDAFVDGLDLATASFSRVEPKMTGRPGYAPADLLKLYIYGYLNRVRSSRRLEAETHRNIEVIWLLRHLKPDFKTIADFRRDNRNAFRQVFREFVLLCRQLDLFGRELLAVDGTRIKAVNNKDRNFTRASLTQFVKAADAKLEDYLQRLDKSDATESTTGGSRVKNLTEKIAAIRERRERHKDMLAELDQTGESQISLTDPDSRAMAAHTRVAVGYNVQIAVDAKHKLIVEQQVTNQVVDMGLWPTPPNRQKRFSESSASRSWPTGAISRSRTSRLASRPGSILTCRVPSVVPRSERAYSGKMSLAMTRPVTIFSAQQVSVFIPIRLLFCVA